MKVIKKLLKNHLKKHRGFTLIELLVVVLIIGILAGIALPHYKKAVTKSKAAQMQGMLATLAQSMDRYYLVQGKYARRFHGLDVNLDLPTTDGQLQGYTCGGNLISQSVIHGDDFEIVLYDQGWSGYYMMSAHFTKGKYKCRGFVHYFNGYGKYDGSTYCGEHYYDRSCGSAGCDTGVFCKDVMGMSYVGAGNIMDLYK